MIPLSNIHSTSLLLQVGRGKFIPMQTFAECQEAVARISSGIGSTTYYNNEIGTILHPTKGAFARVSYNGRVWKGVSPFSSEEITELNTNDF